MLARRADSLLSLMGETEKIFLQPSQYPTVGLLGEFVDHQAHCSHFQDEEGDLTVFWSTLGVKNQRAGARAPGDQAFCRWLKRTGGLRRRIAEGLNCVTLAFLVDARAPPPPTRDFLFAGVSTR